MINILVMDDETGILSMIEEQLQSELECNVSCCENGLDGFMLAQTQQFDFICTDYSMPVMTGGAFVESIRSKESPNKKTPILFISAFIGKAKNLNDKYDDIYYVDKPIDFEKVLETIRFSLKITD